LRQIRRIVIHCSDSADSQDIGRDEITAWHRARGFATIGYHSCIRRSGAIEIGRPESEIGAHVQGHNADTLGVCVVGRKDFTPAQMLALVTLVRSWMRKYNIPADKVLGHYELDSGKSCPNLKMSDVRKALA